MLVLITIRGGGRQVVQKTRHNITCSNDTINLPINRVHLQQSVTCLRNHLYAHC